MMIALGLQSSCKYFRAEAMPVAMKTTRSSGSITFFLLKRDAKLSKLPPPLESVG
jgi:hypothetical protein